MHVVGHEVSNFENISKLKCKFTKAAGPTNACCIDACNSKTVEYLNC